MQLQRFKAVGSRRWRVTERAGLKEFRCFGRRFKNGGARPLGGPMRSNIGRRGSVIGGELDFEAISRGRGYECGMMMETGKQAAADHCIQSRVGIAPHDIDTR